MDEANTVLLGLLDLSAVLDTIDYDILLYRLEASFEIVGPVLNWFRSYLTDRSQSVRISGCYSAQTNLRYGMPQGSVQYTAPLLQIIHRHGLQGHCYADDTQVYFCCAPDQMSILATTLSACIVELQQWMSANRLKLNCDKTEVLCLSSRDRLVNLAARPQITVGSSLTILVEPEILAFILMNI